MWYLRSLTDSFREAAGTTGKDKFISPEPISTAWDLEMLIAERSMIPVMGNSDVLSDIETVFNVLN